MGKNESDLNSRPPERSPAARPGNSDHERACGQQLAVSARKDGLEAQSAPAQANAYPMPRSHRELGMGIFAVENPIKVGSELLNKEASEDRGAPTRLRSLQTFADWAFEKPVSDGQRKPPRIIWDIPGPPYEPVDPLEPELEKSEGGEK
jgi:hypothetical protein